MAAQAPNNDRFLQQLEDIKRQQKHLERLRTMKSAVDNHTASDYGSRLDTKRIVRRREKADQIHKENMKILNKIASIVKRKNETFHGKDKDTGFKTHATVNRSKANGTIEKENNILHDRLKTISSKSIYSRERFEKERQETEKHLKRISHSHQRELREHYLHKFLKTPGTPNSVSPSGRACSRFGHEFDDDYEDFEDDEEETKKEPEKQERREEVRETEETNSSKALKENPQTPKTPVKVNKIEKSVIEKRPESKKKPQTPKDVRPKSQK